MSSYSEVSCIDAENNTRPNSPVESDRHHLPMVTWFNGMLPRMNVIPNFAPQRVINPRSFVVWWPRNPKNFRLGHALADVARGPLNPCRACRRCVIWITDRRTKVIDRGMRKSWSHVPLMRCTGQDKRCNDEQRSSASHRPNETQDQRARELQVTS